MLWTPFRDRHSRRSARHIRRSTRDRLARRRFEALESRRLLTIYAWDNTANTLEVRLENDMDVTVTQSSAGVSFQISGAAGTFSPAGPNTATGSGTTTLVFNSADLATSVRIQNAAAGAGSVNDVTFSGMGMLSSGTIDVSLGTANQAAMGTILFTGGFDISTTNSIYLSTPRNIGIGSGSVVSASGSGSITMEANRQSTQTSGTFVGLVLSGGRVTTTGTGDILLKGRGGNVSNNNRGIELRNSAKVLSTATGATAGTITLDGMGTAGTSFNEGVFIDGVDTLITSIDGDIDISGHSDGGPSGVDISNSTISSTGVGANAANITIHGVSVNGGLSDVGVKISSLSTHVTSVDGDIQITGHGADGDSGGHIGVWIFSSAKISSTGTGAGAATITITGNGGNGTTDNVGVVIFGAQTLVTSAYGDIRILGQGGNGTGFQNYGIRLSGNARVSSTGTGIGAAKITFEGTGGQGTERNFGVRFFDASTPVTSVDGTIELIATAGANTNAAFLLDVNAQIQTTGAATVVVTADSAELANGTAIDAGSNVVHFKTKTTTGAVGINLGGVDTAATLGLTDTELDRVKAGKILIGAEAIPNTILISFGLQHLGDADFEVVTGRNIVVMTGGIWFTTDGDLTFRANRGATPASSGLRGIDVNGGMITTVGTGDIFLSGRGASTGSQANGIELRNGGKLTSTATGLDAGTITLDGAGALGTTLTSGVYMVGVNSQITSVDGDIRIVGQGSGVSGSNRGVFVNTGSQIHSTGLATITLEGVGGQGGNSNHGVQILGTNTLVTSKSGDISIIGQAGGSVADNAGVHINGDALVSSTGTGPNAAKISITGTGGGGSVNNYGVHILFDGQIATLDGDIEITGQATGSSFAVGINVEIGSEITSSGSADVSLIADGIRLSSSRVEVGAMGAVTLRQRNDGTLIRLGGVDAAGTLGLSAAELQSITAGAIIIGDSNSGDITVATQFAVTTPTDLILHSSGAIVFDPGRVDTAGGALLLDPGIGPVRPITAGVDAYAGTVSFASDLGIAINGPTVDAEFNQLKVIGTVDLSGVELVLSGAYVPVPGSSFTIVSATSVANKFVGLDDGDLINFNGIALKVHYSSTAVTLTANGAPTASNVSLETQENITLIAFQSLPASDPQGDDLTYAIVSGPTHGVITAFDAATGTFTYQPDAGHDGADSFTYKVSDGHLDSNVATVSLTITPVYQPEELIVLGADAGARPRVKLIDADDGSVVGSFLAYTSTFKGGVRVAVADLNHDGEAEIVVAPGAGMSTLVKVFDVSGRELRDYRTKAYRGFSSGVFVAAGDVNGDGRVDIITSPGEGLNSNIKVFKNRVGIVSTNPDPISNNPIYSFLAFDTITRRGATVAARDFTGDGKAEIVVGNSAGTSPLVRMFDLTDILSTPQLQLADPMLELRPFNDTDRGGVFVAVGNVRGDATPEIIVGNGANGRGRIEMYSATGSRFKSVTAYDDGEGRNAPVHVAAKSIDADTLDEVLTSQGPPSSSGRLRAFNGDGTLEDDVFELENDFRFGFFVA